MVGPRSGAEECPRWKRNPFSREERLLDLEQPPSVARPLAAVPAQRTVPGDDAMAGDHEADGIASDRTADGTRGTRAASHSGDASVARDLSVVHRPNHHMY